MMQLEMGRSGMIETVGGKKKEIKSNKAFFAFRLYIIYDKRS